MKLSKLQLFLINIEEILTFFTDFYSKLIKWHFAVTVNFMLKNITLRNKLEPKLSMQYLIRVLKVKNKKPRVLVCGLINLNINF